MGGLRDRVGRYGPTSAAVGVTALPTAFVGAFVGSAVLFVVLESWWLFVVLFGGLFCYLSQRDSLSEVVGRGLYAVAFFVLLYPAVVLLDLLASPADPDGGALFIADVLYTLVIRAPVALVLAGATAGAGYLFDRRTAELDRRTKEPASED